MDPFVSGAVGLGLAAACGFRVFVPLLGLCLAARAAWLPLSPGFEWMASDGALVAFATATVVEVAAYYVPWLDHALDVLASPAAIAAGVLASAAVFVDLPPLLRWAAAIVGGGAAAGLVQGATVLIRGKTSALTAGLANPGVSTAELLLSGLTSFLAIVVPVACLLLLAAGAVVVVRASRRLLPGRRRAGPGGSPGTPGGGPG